MQSFVDYVRSEMLTHMQQGFSQQGSAMVPLRRPVVVVPPAKGKR